MNMQPKELNKDGEDARKMKGENAKKEGKCRKKL